MLRCSGCAPISWDAIMETGEGSGLVPAGLPGATPLRIEAGCRCTVTTMRLHRIR